jgi:hypothetical protein
LDKPAAPAPAAATTAAVPPPAGGTSNHKQTKKTETHKTLQLTPYPLKNTHTHSTTIKRQKKEEHIILCKLVFI